MKVSVIFTLWARTGLIWAVLSAATTQAKAQRTPTTGDLANALRTPTPALQLGQLDGDSPHVFGRIRDVGVLPNGDVFVLDDLMYEIRWFDSQGRHVAQSGRNGSGPGEFRSPAAMFVEETGVIHTYDRRNGRISVFQSINGALVHERDIRLDLTSVDDLCVMNGDYYFVTPNDSSVVQRFDKNGKRIAAFGARPSLSNLLNTKLPSDPSLAASIAGSYNGAMIYCDPVRQSVVLVYRQLPLVRAFTAAGGAVWETHLSDFHQLRWIPVRGSTAYQQAADPRSGIVTMASALVQIDRQRLAVTYVDGGLTKRAEPSRHVRLFSLLNGQEIARLPTLLTLIGRSGTALYMSSSRPFPHLRVVKYPQQEIP